uniref:Uncharacterized protein n=1 Tax=Amphimedon queenslandica TaxID=400682 RepID=A0A1X7V262_AMPQE
SCIPETGRCGRDGKQSEATLLVNKKLPKTLQYKMKEYVQNTTLCRRDLLFETMEG